MSILTEAYIALFLLCFLKLARSVLILMHSRNGPANETAQSGQLERNIT